MSYSTDRGWSDLMCDHIRQIVGPHLLRPTPFVLDTKFAADFYVFTAKDMTIAARVRRPGYADRYPFEFTLRSCRDNGVKTELAKIIDGWGDWLFYGHATSDDRICGWWLIDLASFRAGIIRHVRGEHKIRFTKKSNGDGTHFIAYDVRTFAPEPPLLIARSENFASAFAEIRPLREQEATG